MAISIAMTGSGSIGDLAPGWSVQEFATPLIIGDTTGGTGNVSMSGKANDETLFIVNNGITTTVDGLGSIAGVIKSVSQTGMNASVSHNTEMALFDADLKIPALGTGGVVPAIDLCSQLTGRDIILQKDTGYYYSLRGHSQGFDSNGAVAVGRIWDTYVTDNYGIKTYYQGQTGSIFGSKFFTLNNDIWASYIRGDYYEDNTAITSSRIAYKLMLNNGISYFATSSKLDKFGQNEGAYYFTLKIDSTNGIASIDGEVIIGGYLVTISSSQSIAGLDLTKELSVFTEFKRPTGYSGLHTFTAIFCNTSDYSVSASTGFFYDGARASGSDWSISSGTVQSGVRGLYKVEDTGLPSSGFATVAVNYALNPNFETNLNNWDTFGSSVTKTQVTGGYSGTKSMRIIQPIQEYNQYLYGVSQRFDLPPESTIWNPAVNYFSIHAKGPSGTTTYFNVVAEQYDVNNQLINTGSSTVLMSVVSSSGNWVNVPKSIPINPGATYIVVKVVGTGAEYYLDGASLIKISNYYNPPAYFDGDTTDTSTYNYVYDSNGYSLQQASVSAINQEYENIANYTYGENIIVGGPVPATNSNGWQYIQDACSAYGQEVSIVNSQIIIRNIAENVLSIDNIVGSPTITPNIMLGGRNVEVVYSGATNGDRSIFYSARTDDNRVLTVKANESLTTTVTLNGTPTILTRPSRTTSISTLSNPYNGYYYVSAANGSGVAASQWEDYGGSIRIEISKTIPNSADIILTGPSQDIPSNIGPYKIAYTADGTDYAALTIAGSGVLTNNKTLKLLTGADQLKVPQDVAKTVTNPFIDTQVRAYDRGIHLASAASGPTVTLSGTIPVSAITSFGLNAGSFISYRDSKYRVNDVTIGSLAVSFNASRYVTVGDFDAIWNGYTAEVHDITWSNHDTSDQIIAPLYFIGDDESLILALDADINPYYNFSGTPEISVHPDIDNSPYYIPDPDAAGAEPVYLDTDTNPYVED